MALKTLPASPVADEPIQMDQQDLVHEVQFGDGYSQRVGYGINSVVERYELNYTNLTGTEKDTIKNFLDSLYVGEAFYYTVPGDTQKKFCLMPGTSKRVSKSGGLLWNISFTIRRVFDNVT